LISSPLVAPPFARCLDVCFAPQVDPTRFPRRALPPPPPRVSCSFPLFLCARAVRRAFVFALFPFPPGPLDLRIPVAFARSSGPLALVRSFLSYFQRRSLPFRFFTHRTWLAGDPQSRAGLSVDSLSLLFSLDFQIRGSPLTARLRTGALHYLSPTRISRGTESVDFSSCSCDSPLPGFP